MASATDLKQPLTDHVNSNQRVLVYCNAIVNTVISPPTPNAQANWYHPFMQNLATAQTHATSYITTLGPTFWSTIPNLVITYGQSYQNGLTYVQQTCKTAEGASRDLTTAELQNIKAVFQQLDSQLTALMGAEGDSVLNAAAAPTLKGVSSDLAAFTTNLISDNKNLTTGQNSAASEVGLLNSDETTMQGNITNLNTEIQAYDKIIMESEIGIGVSIFITVIGIALAPVSGGASLVVTGVGVAGIAGSIAGTVVYSGKVQADQDKIAQDQSEIDTDKQQVNALNGIISTMSTLSGHNADAQNAVESMLDTFGGLQKETQTTINDLTGVDSSAALGIIQELNIQAALDAWDNAVTLAQNILGMNTQLAVLTPPTT